MGHQYLYLFFEKTFSFLWRKIYGRNSEGIPTYHFSRNRIELLCWTSENQQELKLLEEFVSDCYIFELDQEIKKETINIRRGFKVKLPDAIIGATSRINKLTLLTRNVKDFERIDSLKIINPWQL